MMAETPPDCKSDMDAWGKEPNLADDVRPDAEREALRQKEREAAAKEGRLRTSRKKQPRRRSTGLKKQLAQREADPEERKVVARQKKLAEAMELLHQWDEEQEEFTLANGDPNAPLGDWRGFRRRLTAEERGAMREACRTLTQDAKFVLVGFNAKGEESALASMTQWVEGLGLPPPEQVVFTDDAMSTRYGSREEMPDGLVEELRGPVHVAYNSKADADPETGDDEGAPAMALMMPYPAPDRSCVFTPILEGFFTQYGDIPLDLFDVAKDDAGGDADEYLADRLGGSDGGEVAMRQHASMGNEEAAKQLALLEKQRKAEASVDPDLGEGCC